MMNSHPTSILQIKMDHQARLQIPNHDLDEYFSQYELSRIDSTPLPTPLTIDESCTLVDKLRHKLQTLNPKTLLSSQNLCQIEYTCGNRLPMPILVSHLLTYNSAFTRDDCGSCNCTRTNCRAKAASGIPYFAFKEIKTSEDAFSTLSNIKKLNCSCPRFAVKDNTAYEMKSFVLFEQNTFKCIVDFKVSDNENFSIFPQSFESIFKVDAKSFLARSQIRAIIYVKAVNRACYLDKFIERISEESVIGNNKFVEEQNVEDLKKEIIKSKKELNIVAQVAVAEYDGTEDNKGYLEKAFMPVFVGNAGFSFFYLKRSKDDESNCNRCSDCGQLFPKYMKKCLKHK